MQALLRYEHVIYDANCIVYYCFKIEEKDIDGNTVPILGPETEKARRITRSLMRNKKSVLTLKIAWQEAREILPGKALESLIQEGYIQRHLRTSGAIPPALKFKLAKALSEQLERMATERWFVINTAFVANPQRIEAVRELYRQFALNPTTQNRIPPFKGDPSVVDISLLLYSKEIRAPLLTNDREIYNFAPELAMNGFCEVVRGFREVRFS